ncbi:MAG: MFS transporter [Phycisphaerales bacterium]
MTAPLGLLLVVLLSPFIGALADQRAWKRELLLASGAICASLTVVLGLLQPGQVALAAGVYLIAAVACGLGENGLGSFLPEISTPKTVGRVSAIGWTTSYIGALLLLGITAAYTLGFGRDDPTQMRPMLLFAGLWFAVGMIPAVVWLRERAQPQSTPSTSLFASVCGRLVRSAKETKHFTQLTRFFLAFAVYSAGTMTMIFGLGLIGDRLGFELNKLILMAAIIAVTAGLSAAIAGRYQDRVGHTRTICAYLGIWIVATLAMAAAEWIKVPEIVYWTVSGLIGVALGGIGTASRAIVGAFTPESRAGEFFGLWGMIYKLAGVGGVVIFGWMSALLGQPIALLVVAGMFAVGLMLLLRVDEVVGVEEAGIAAGDSHE